MVSFRQYYFFAIWLPIVLPLVIMNFLGVEYKSQFDFLYLYGVFPYILFGLFVIYKHNNSEAEKLGKFSSVAPLYFLLFYFVFFTLSPLFHSKSYTEIISFIEGIRSMFLLSIYTFPFVIFVGYFYVGLVYALYFILRDIGFIKLDKYQIKGKKIW